MALLVIGLLSCGEGNVRSAPRVAIDAVMPLPTQSVPTDARVVLLTIDGVRWQDVFEGSDPTLSGAESVPAEKLMPRTYALLEGRGVALGARREGCGAVRTASGANVSLPGYQEIFTGRPSPCRDNDCRIVRQTVMDEAAAARVAGVASIGAWAPLGRAVSGGASGVFVATGRNWSATSRTMAPALDALVRSGAEADPFPGHDDYRPDEHTASIALEYFRTMKPAFLHVGLGDTDEWAHRGDYRAYLTALHHADSLIGDLADTLDTMGDAGRRTTIIVTTDHGRNSDFQGHGALRMESGRTFMLLFGERVATHGVGCPRRDITLADIAPTIRTLMGLPRDHREGAGNPIDEIR